MTRSRKGLLFWAMLGSVGLASSPSTSNEDPSSADLHHPFCSITLPPLALGPGMTYALGSFAERVVEVGPGPISSSGLADRAEMQTDDETIRGQYMQVSGAGGWAAESVHDQGTTSETEMIVVVWGYDPRCSVARYAGAIPFGVPGEEALVQGRLRDADQWIDGVPVVDTYWGGGLVYPVRALVGGRTSLEWDRNEPLGPARESLSAAEAFELMNMMPEPCEELWSPTSFAVQSAVVTVTYMEDERYPVPSALRLLGERAREPEERRPSCLGDPRTVSLP